MQRMLNRVEFFRVITCAAILLGVHCEGIMAGELQPKAPIGSIRTIIEANELGEFFESLEEFATKHAFAFRVAPVRPDGKHVVIQMWREDIEVIGTNPFEVGEFRIRFYEAERGTVPKNVVENLVSDLRLMLTEKEL